MKTMLGACFGFVFGYLIICLIFNKLRRKSPTSNSASPSWRKDDD